MLTSRPSPLFSVQLLYSNKCAQLFIIFISKFALVLTPFYRSISRSEGCQIEQEYLSNFEQVLDVFVSTDRARDLPCSVRC